MKGWMTRVFSLLMIAVVAITLAACIQKVEVTFNADNGSDAEVVEVNSGDMVAEPTDPTKTGFTFVAWYLGEDEYDFTTPVTENITLVAHWEADVAVTYTVTFDSDGGSSVAAQTIDDGQTASEPEDPTKTGYTFIGWYLGEDEYDFTTPVTENITLVAHWEADVAVTYTVTFDSDGGSSVAAQTINDGQTALEPEDPTKAGYTFIAWYLGESEYDFATPITEDITLVAHWQEGVMTHTVSFNTVGASQIPNQTIDDGEVALEPAAPEKAYFSFEGWLLNGEPFLFTTAITGDIELKANYSFLGIPDSPTYVGRDFNGDFDQLINDYTSETIQGTAVSASIDADQPYISVGYSGEIGNNPDGALWKQAGSQNSASAAFQYLVLRLRGFEGASISDLSIGFRLDDNHEVLVVPLTEALDPDLEPISRELDGDWFNYVISITDTLDGKSFIGKTGYSDTEASGLLVGFHLMNTSENGSGILHLKDAYYTKLPNPAFPYEGTDYSQNRDYWFGSVGTTVSTYVSVFSGGSYSEYVAIPNELNTHLVLRLRQGEAGTFDPTSLTIAPVFSDGTIGDAIAYDQIADMPLLGSSWLNVTIPFAAIYSGEDIVAGYEITNNGDVAVDITQSFLSYLGDYQAVSYPVLDLENSLIYDDFDRAEIGTTPAYTSDNPIALANDFTYLISYGGLQASSIGDGAITLDSTGGGYMSYTVHSSVKANRNEYRYLVIKYQLSETGSLNDLRLQQTDYNDAAVGGIVYANQWVAGLGLPSIPEDASSYPYVQDGWTYLVVDLLLTEGYSTDFAGFTLYYTGSSMSIDAILFANAMDAVDESTAFLFADFEGLTVDTSANGQISDNQWWANVYDSPTTIVADGEGQALQIDGTGYAQYHTASKGTGYYLAFDLKVTTPGTIESFRLGPDGNIKWVKDGEVILASGIPMVVNEDGQWHHYVIDWVASGFAVTDTIGFHASDGEIYLLDNLTWLQPYPYFDDELVWGDFEWATVGDANGQFSTSQYWANNYGSASSIVDVEGNLKLKLDATSGYVQYHTGVMAKPHYVAFDITVEAEGSLGIMLGGTHKWNAELIGLDGNPIVLPGVGQSAHIVVDVQLSGLLFSDEFAIEANDAAVYYIDNISFQWNEMLAPLHEVLSNDYEAAIVDDQINYWWHSGDPSDGVLSLVTADYLGVRFGSPVIANATVIKLDAKLSEEGADASQFRLELGDGNIVNWSQLVADGVVANLTTDMQTFVIDIAPYLSGHPSTLQVFGFHINNGGVVVDNLSFYQNEYAHQMNLLVLE